MDSRHASIAAAYRLPGPLLALALFSLSALAADQAADRGEPVQVYVAWESASRTARELVVRCTGGVLVRWQPSTLEPLRITAEQQDTVWRFRWERPVPRGGLDLRLACKASDQIEVEIDGKSLRTTLKELTEGPASIRWAQGSLTLSRPASDAIRVTPASGRLLFTPGEKAILQFQVYLLADKPKPIPTSFRLGLAHYGQEPVTYPVKARYEITANQPARSRFNLEMNAPAQPGLYELVARVKPADQPEIVRRIPLAVLDTIGAHRTGGHADWDAWLAGAKPVRAAHYDGKQWREHLPWWFGVRRLRELWRGVRVAHAEDAADRWAIELPEPSRPYLLTLHATGRPGSFGLVAEVARGLEQHLPIAEPLRAGIWLDEPAGEAKSAERTVRLLVLPTGGRLKLHVRASAAANAVHEARWSVAGLDDLNRLQLREPQLADPTANRIAILYLPDYAQLYNFAQTDNPTARHWSLLLSAASNLTTYAAGSDYDGIAVPVTGKGIVSWPSAQAQSSFVWDPDRLPGPTQDPVPKDVPELLLRACRQRSLLFIPLFRFDGLELSGASDLNPLRPADRSRMVQLVAEFVARYKQHDNLRAIGVVISPRARTCLAGPADGLDQETVQQFVKDSKLTPPADLKGQQLVTWALEKQRDRLMAWRARQVLELYKSLVAAVRKEKPKAICYLAVDFTDLSWADQLRQASHRGDDLATVLRESGLDLASWTLPEGLVLVRPFFNSEHSATTLWINRDRELDRFFARHPHASLFAAEQMVLAADNTRRRITVVHRGQGGASGATRALANLEPVALFAAPLLPVLPQQLGQHTLTRVLRQLPLAASQRKASKGPVRVKAWRTGHVVMWLVANLVGHPVRCDLEFTRPGQVHVAVTSDRTRHELSEDGRQVRVDLSPYGLALLRSPDSTELASLDVTLPEAAQSALQRRFRQMTRAVSFLRNADRAASPNLVLDGVFEQPDGMATRWEIFPPQHGAYSEEAAYHGKLGLDLTPKDKQGVYALSWPFTVPPGAKLSVKLAARRLDDTAELFVWLVPTDRPQEHAAAFKVPLTAEWQTHRVQLTPGTGYEEIWSWRLVLHARQGRVQVDDVEAAARTLTAEERNAMIKSLAPALRAWYDKRLADFSDLTAQYWPQYLLRQFGADSDETVEDETNPDDTSEEPDARSSSSDAAP